MLSGQLQILDITILFYSHIEDLTKCRKGLERLVAIHNPIHREFNWFVKDVLFIHDYCNYFPSYVASLESHLLGKLLARHPPRAS